MNKGIMKKFFNEFKQFINRGNVLDLAIGVIIGGAFSSIVTALTQNIIQPLINWIIALVFDGASNQPVYTVLRGVYVDGLLDTTKSIYIDWGAFISAIINFILIALVLFFIIKAFNKINEQNSLIKKSIINSTLTKGEKKEMKSLGLNYKDIKEIKKFKENKQAQLKAEQEKAEADKKLLEEEAKKHTTEALLEQIKEILERKC